VVLTKRAKISSGRALMDEPAGTLDIPEFRRTVNGPESRNAAHALEERADRTGEADMTRSIQRGMMVGPAAWTSAVFHLTDHFNFTPRGASNFFTLCRD
jgi:hypothetical protein